jgi:4-amino-4-deoxy-L-arabinose transferase-like glycosyltransferase
MRQWEGPLAAKRENTFFPGRDDVRMARIACVAILMLAAVLRLWGIGFGIPHPLARPDEEAIMTVALRFFQRQGNPGFFDHPSLFMYATCIVYIGYFNFGRHVTGWFRYEGDLCTAASIAPGPFYLMARALSALAGVVTVGTVYQVGGALFDRTTALVSAAFLAVAALHVRDSHFGVSDISATCGVMLSFLATVRYAKSGRRRDLVMSALWAGVATSTKYNAALVALPGLWALWSHASSDRRAWWRSRLTAGYLAVVGLTFLAGTPYALLDWPHFLESLRGISEHLRGGHAQFRPAFIVHFSSSLWYGIGWPMLAMSVAGMVAYIRRSPAAGLLFALFPVSYYVGIGTGRTAFARYILPVVPFLCVSAAYATVTATRKLTALWGRSAWAPAATWVMAAAVALPSLAATIATDRLLTRTDTRVLAADWIRSHTSPATTVYQSGAGYTHVYLKTPPLNTYPELEWDETRKAFRDEQGVPADAPALIVIPECPLAYCDTPASILDLVAHQYRGLQRFQGYQPGAPLTYDRDDAFFVPLAGFGAVERPGPNVTIFARR